MRWMLALTACLTALTPTLPARALAAGDLAAGVVGLVNRERGLEGAGKLDARRGLMRAAEARAEEIARMPLGEGMVSQRPLREILRDHHVAPVLRAQEYQLLRRGSTSASELVGSWRDSAEAWRLALDPGFDAIGVGTARGRDGWLVVAVVLVRDARVPEDLGPMEQATVAAVNRVRVARGLAALKATRELTDLAREHSRDMARRGYSAHSSPEGQTVSDRLRARGLGYRVVAENIAYASGVEDVVGTIVSGWASSPGHLANIVSPELEETGVGIAVNEAGRFYFTQVFRLP